MKKALLISVAICLSSIGTMALAKTGSDDAPGAIAQADVTPQVVEGAATQTVEPAGDETVTPTIVPREGLGDYIEARLREPAEAYPYIEHRGYFRFRTDNFWNLDLDTGGTSPILPPLEATHLVRDSISESSDYYDADAELIAGANIRMRYHPIVHIANGTRLHLELDILDNLVLGSTPGGYSITSDGIASRFDSPLVFLSDGQQSPNEDLTFSDAVEVRQLYAETEFFGLVRVGRMADHWGLGMVANSGGTVQAGSLSPRTSFRGYPASRFECTDCDYGDIVDRASLTARILPKIPLYLGVALGWASQGTQSYLSNQPSGQAHDLSEIDDNVEWVFTAMRTYLTDREIRQRDHQLHEMRQPVLEGGARLVLRNQAAEQGEGGFYPNDLTTGFRPRQAQAIIPDLWARLLWKPRSEWMMRFELEAAAVFGSIEGYRGADPDEGSVERSIQQFGLAFESDLQFDNLFTGLNAGFATGRSPHAEVEELSAGWGVLDRNTVMYDEDVTNFVFDRNYTVDMIMFREVIGAITNAIYVNPFFRYDFFTQQESALGFRVDGIYAHALAADVTPGGESPIGIEGDVSVFYRTASYQADVAYGLFAPFGALDGAADRARIPAVAEYLNLNEIYDEAVGAGLAHTLQIRLTWAF